MGHKVLKDHAYVFCQMFMGWRMADDLSTFAELPDGILEINILDGTCSHSRAGPINTAIAGELRAWFLDRLQKHDIPIAEITRAELSVTMKNSIPSAHKRGINFDWICEAKISTPDRDYSANLAEPHTWMPMPSAE